MILCCNPFHCMAESNSSNQVSTTAGCKSSSAGPAVTFQFVPVHHSRSSLLKFPPTRPKEKPRSKARFSFILFSCAKQPFGIRAHTCKTNKVIWRPDVWKCHSCQALSCGNDIFTIVADVVRGEIRGARVKNVSFNPKNVSLTSIAVNGSWVN